MTSMDYLQLSIRHFKYNEVPQYHSDLGEVVYTLNTSNFSWPRGVTYPEVLRARDGVIACASVGR